MSNLAVVSGEAIITLDFSYIKLPGAKFNIEDFEGWLSDELTESARVGESR